MFGEAVFIFLLLVWQVFKVPKLKKVAAYISVVNVINNVLVQSRVVDSYY